MIDFISNLRNKPENLRIRILWGSVVLCMIVVIGIWFVDLQGKIQRGSGDNSLKEAVEDFVEETGSIKSDIQSSVGSLMNTEETEKEINEIEEKEIKNDYVSDKAYQLPLEE